MANKCKSTEVKVFWYFDFVIVDQVIPVDWFNHSPGCDMSYTITANLNCPLHNLLILIILENCIEFFFDSP